MLATAKVFTNGNSQAIRLPKAFRVDVDEMWIACNEVTGEITLKPKDTETLRKRRLDALMATIAENPLPDSFLSEASRQNNPPQNPFADWENPSVSKVSAKASAKASAKRTAKTKDPK
jgi:antitoxin VapB